MKVKEFRNTNSKILMYNVDGRLQYFVGFAEEEQQQHNNLHWKKFIYLGMIFIEQKCMLKGFMWFLHIMCIEMVLNV